MPDPVYIIFYTHGNVPRREQQPVIDVVFSRQSGLERLCMYVCTYVSEPSVNAEECIIAQLVVGARMLTACREMVTCWWCCHVVAVGRVGAKKREGKRRGRWGTHPQRNSWKLRLSSSFQELSLMTPPFNDDLHL